MKQTHREAGGNKGESPENDEKAGGNKGESL
jgi:hypothetical protein